MAEVKKVKTRIMCKHDTEEHWGLANNFVPLAGEIIIYDADEQHSIPRIKIGDGNTPIANLSFINSDDNNVPDALGALIGCGTTDPDTSSTSKFYFKYSE